MHARLPIAVAPAHHETASSYITRLANLHGIPFPELWRQVSRPRQPASTTMLIAGDRLAAVTGIPQTRLARALIEIRHPEPDWLALRHEPQPGCPRCTARHTGGSIRQLLPHHRYVCTLHRIWIGPPDLTDQPYPSLEQLPEIVAAQRAHLRLLHRLGPVATYDAVLTGFLICGHRWDQEPDPTTDLDARHTWRKRVDMLIPPGTEQTSFSTSRLFAATYPEAVKIAALVGSLHWRRLAAGDPDGQRRFAAEIGRRLGQPDYRPKVTKDSIAHWIDDDCWRPPGLPPTTYRTLPGFGNQTITKPNQHSLDRHHRSAHWFARNRRGGRVILYHRHVGSVLARDWSRKMEQFVGTVEASAETRSFREVDGQEQTPESAADYIRPTAVESDYLNSAVSPACLPIRRRPPAG